MSDLKKIVELSRVLGRRIDFVQGSGGNVSIKINDKIMLIKASGWRLADISENEGLVAVDYNKIANEKKFDFSGSTNLRPSIEVGFHTFLSKYIIHTHSVYTNIIGCVIGGEKIWRNIIEKSGISAEWIGYENPGEHLALAVKNIVREHKIQFGEIPKVILMQNHGLVVSSDDLKDVFEIHNEIQNIIKKSLNLKKDFPKIGSSYLKNFIKDNYGLIEDFSENILFPDQAVFCNSIGNKIIINKAMGDIIYKVDNKEALAIEEIMTAWAYIVDCARDCGFILNPISKDSLNYINNMESEKYRQKLIKK